LPTPADRLFFLLTSLKTYALQVVHGRLFGMPQCKANPGIHGLLPLLLTTLRPLGDAPARSLAALAQRLGVTMREAAAVVTPLEAEDAPVGAAAVVTPLTEVPTPAARSLLPRRRPPPLAHDGTERRIVRPQDPAEQKDGYSGKQKAHTVQNVLLVHAPLTILLLSDTYGGHVHDKRIAEATPYPLPAGSRL